MVSKMILSYFLDPRQFCTDSCIIFLCCTLLAGSSGVQIPYGSFPSDVHSTQRPPTMDLPMNADPLVGSFHNEVQHGGAYPQPPTVRPPSLEFPSSVQHPSFCPPRPGWY